MSLLLRWLWEFKCVAQWRITYNERKGDGGNGMQV